MQQPAGTMKGQEGGQEEWGRGHEAFATRRTVTKALFGDGGGRRQERGVNTAISQKRARLPIPAGILLIPVFSTPVALFSEESRFLFRHNFFGTHSGNLSVWGLRRKLCRISIC
jgi:hypothetical protein